MISVVMATYNGERYIKEQLLSILNQTMVPDEIIIRDDVSTDNTVGIITNIIQTHPMGNRINLEINDHNLGYCKNFFKAIFETKGDYIFLSDQDDIWYRDKIEVMIGVFDGNNGVIDLSTSYDLIDCNGKIIGRGKKSKRLNKIDTLSFVRHPKYPGMSVAIKRVVVNELLKLDLHGFVAHDWMLHYVSSMMNGMYFYEYPTGMYRQHENNQSGMALLQSLSNSRKQRVKMIDSMYENELAAYQQCKNGPLKEKLNEIMRYQKKRIEYINAGRGLSLLLHNIRNIDYTSIRSICGDLWVMR